MTFAREQTGSGIKSDPAPAGQINFRPGVEISEIFFRTTRAVERFYVGLELDQVAADEPRREAEVPHKLHLQPSGVATRTAHLRERFLRRLHAGLHADGVFDVLPKPLVDGNEEIVRGLLLAVRQLQPLPLGSAFNFTHQVAAQLCQIF